jgi:O-antigen ligase
MSIARVTLPVTAVLLVALPWINPFAPGPTPATVQCLVAWTFLALFAQVSACSGQYLKADSVAVGWLVAALISSVLAVFQFGGLGDAWMPWVNATQAGEAFGNLRQRNQLASLTSMGLVAILCMQKAADRGRPWQLAGAILLGVGNACTSSRTGLIQLLSVATFFWCFSAWRTSHRRQLVAATLLSYLVATLALPMFVGGGFATSGLLSRFDISATCASRWVLWRNVLHLIELRPLTGWGWGELDYAHLITPYAGLRFCEIPDNAHNLPLHLAVELGLPFALIASCFAIWLVWRSQPSKEHNPSRQLAWGVLAVIFIHSLLEYPLWYGPFQIAVVLCVILLVRSPQIRVEESSPLSGSIATRSSIKGTFGPSGQVALRTFVFLAAGGGILALAYAGWDYHRISQIYLNPAERSPAYRHNTLEKIRSSWLFRDQVQYAELIITPVTRENALAMNKLAHAVLHFSPEAKVVEKLIQSARLLGRVDEVAFFEDRYKAAYPESYWRWQAKQN